MSEYGGRERLYRARAHAGRAEPQTDTVTSALTAQILLCVILVICLLVTKKLGNEDYLEIKQQYRVMLTDTTETAQLAEKITDSKNFSSLTAWLRQFINSRTPESAVSGGGMAEPEMEPEIEAGPDSVPGSSEPLPQMRYDYLKDTSSVYYVSASGGLFPVAEQDTGEMLSPPKGSTLSPVYLTANMKPPVTGIITSGFAYRYHPLTGGSDFHTGLDIAAVEGTPILAALPAEVVEVGYSQIYGNYIVLQHATNLKTSYSHCSEIIAREGMTVRQGERIALVGETGVTTGPHLHFSVIVEDEFTDPAWVLSDYIQLVEE